MNNIVIKGRLTKDPELRQTQSGKSVCSFSVAVTRAYDKENTDFFNCTAWSKTGENISKYFSKGKEIVISGEMNNNPYTDKEGNKRDGWQINVSQFDFCGSKSDNVPSGQPPVLSNMPADLSDFEEIMTDDDSPF